MTEDIVQEATYPFPPAAVWRALTTPAAMSAWLMESTFREPVVGHRFQFRDKPRKLVGWDGTTECEVLEVVPEKRLVFAFGDGRNGFPATRIVWELEPAPDGATRVRFRHSGFTGVKGWLMRAGMSNGWWRIHEHGIPFVVARMLEGRMPTREEMKAAAKSRARGEAAAKKAKA